MANLTSLNIDGDTSDVVDAYTKTEVDSALLLKADASNVYTKTQTDALLGEKQDNLTAGANIQFNGTTISATDTTYSNATDTTAGLIKTDPDSDITLNANGQLEVGGRLGQFPNGGLFYPTDAEPMNVGTYALLMTDALNLSINGRSLVIAGGANVTLRGSHAAGSTVYQVSNSYQNRIALNAYTSGRATLSIDTAHDYTVAITSIKFANGDDISAYSGGTENNNNIIITTEESANPNSATTTIRLYAFWGNTDIISCGQGNGSSGGKTLQVGQQLANVGGIQVIQVGNAIYNNANNSAQFGRQHINKQTDSLLAGYGHDSTNGSQGASAVGLWSSIDTNTAFAVGNGTAVTARSNAFEVTKDSGIILKSPNGTRYKITVDDSGNLTTTAL